jgi:AraC-like DNA-binding protein
VDDIQRVACSIQYMNEHLDRTLRMKTLAELANLSTAHFTAVFRDVMGASPRDYLLFLRMHRARLLLSETDLSIKEIAFRVGYPDPFHFSRVFKAFTSRSPRAYRAGGGPRTHAVSPPRSVVRSFSGAPGEMGTLTGRGDEC